MKIKDIILQDKEFVNIISSFELRQISNKNNPKLDYLKQRDKIIHKDILEKIDKLQKQQISKL